MVPRVAMSPSLVDGYFCCRGAASAAGAPAAAGGRGTMRLNGGQMICQALLNEGVDTVFGIPGGAIIAALPDAAPIPGLRHILVRHEQGAAMAADGYGRITGNVGVCFATSGAGRHQHGDGSGRGHDGLRSRGGHPPGRSPARPSGRTPFQETDVTGVHAARAEAQLPGHDGGGTAPRHQGGRSTWRAPVVQGRYWWTFPRTSSLKRQSSIIRRPSTCRATTADLRK